MTNDPTIPLSEVREAWESDTVQELLDRHTLPDPLLWSIATSSSGAGVVIVQGYPDELGEVKVAFLESGGTTFYQLSDLTFTGDRMARVNDAPEQPEAALESSQNEEYGLLGRWATHHRYGRCVVASAYRDGDGTVDICYLYDSSQTGATRSRVPFDELTFDEDHPEWLETLEDYENAPRLTVVAGASEYAPGYGSAVFQACGLGEWGEDGSPTYYHAEQLAGTCRRVLRWGKEK